MELSLFVKVLQFLQEQLFNRIWGFESETIWSVVEVYVSNIRKMLKKYDYHIVTEKTSSGIIYGYIDYNGKLYVGSTVDAIIDLNKESVLLEYDNYDSEVSNHLKDINKDITIISKNISNELENRRIESAKVKKIGSINE